jgi:hypothetical protein
MMTILHIKTMNKKQFSSEQKATHIQRRKIPDQYDGQAFRKTQYAVAELQLFSDANRGSRRSGAQNEQRKNQDGG